MIAVGIAVVMGVSFLLDWNNYDTVVFVDKEEVIEIEVPVWQTDEEAIKAAQDVIQRKEWEKELEELEAEDVLREARRVELEKNLGTYWKSRANVVALIRATFPEAPRTAVAVAQGESGLEMVQSNFVYTANNVPRGYKVGDREESYCIFQIHAPVHQATAERLGLEDFRTNIESCVAMARVIYDDRNNFTAWSVYLAMI